jgi:hypothetical protein
MDEARGVDPLASRKSTAMQHAQFGSKLFNLQEQQVGISLIDPFGYQSGEQSLSLL